MKSVRFDSAVFADADRNLHEPNTMTDNVNHPAHYEANGPFECIELAQHFNFCIGNAIKYVWRHMDKGKPFEDLSKALWYVQWEMDSTHSSDYHTPIPTYWKLCELVDSDYANMAKQDEALEQSAHDMQVMHEANKQLLITLIDQVEGEDHEQHTR